MFDESSLSKSTQVQFFGGASCFLEMSLIEIIYQYSTKDFHQFPALGSIAVIQTL